MAETTQQVEETVQAVTEAAPEQSSGKVLSQRDYVATPYVATEWEFVGERCEERDFMPMTLEVLKDERLESDPMFECFDGDRSAYAGDTFEAPGGTGKKKVAEEEEQEPQIDMKAFEEELQRKYEEGRLAGLKEGEAAAEVKIVESYEALAGRMREVTEQIKTQVEQRIGRVEKHALKFALEVSRKIVESAAQANPEYIIEVIRKGMRSLGAAKAIRIKVSAEDYEFLDVVGLPADLTPHELGVQYVPDDSVKSGCVIETDFGEVNLELDSMWEEIKKNLFPVCE